MLRSEPWICGLRCRATKSGLEQVVRWSICGTLHRGPIRDLGGHALSVACTGLDMWWNADTKLPRHNELATGGTCRKVSGTGHTDPKGILQWNIICWFGRSADGAELSVSFDIDDGLLEPMAIRYMARVCWNISSDANKNPSSM